MSRRTTAPFSDILCAVDGSRASLEAVRQAVVLAEPDAALSFVAVSHTIGVGQAAQADLSEARAQEALERAAALARDAGISASTELRKGSPTSDVILAEADQHDLLVLGGREGSRAGGIMLGSTASQAAHRAQRPLLVARQPPGAGEFLESILLASDGSPGSWASARATSRVARARGSRVDVVFVPDGVHPERHRELTHQVDAIREATGSEPGLADAPGHVPERIIEVARGEGSSLIVIGRRGLSGIRALGSVSERVVHRAPCSVLVVPPPDDAARVS